MKLKMWWPRKATEDSGYNSAWFITHLQSNLTPTLEFIKVKVLIKFGQKNKRSQGASTMANKTSHWIPRASGKDCMGEGSRTFKGVICEVTGSELPVVRMKVLLCRSVPMLTSSHVSPVIALEKLKKKNNWKYYYYWITRVIFFKVSTEWLPRQPLYPFGMYEDD